MNTLLLIIDMQKAFINENTKHIIPKIEELISKKTYKNIVFTRFINTPESIYVKDLKYNGCIGNDKELVIDNHNYKVIDKKIYTALNTDLKKLYY